MLSVCNPHPHPTPPPPNMVGQWHFYHKYKYQYLVKYYSGIIVIIANDIQARWNNETICFSTLPFEFLTLNSTPKHTVFYGYIYVRVVKHLRLMINQTNPNFGSNFCFQDPVSNFFLIVSLIQTG